MFLLFSWRFWRALVTNIACHRTEDRHLPCKSVIIRSKKSAKPTNWTFKALAHQITKLACLNWIGVGVLTIQSRKFKVALGLGLEFDFEFPNFRLKIVAEPLAL